MYKVYLKFWASWCPICNDGLPELHELFTKEKDYIVYSVVTPNANGEKSIDDFKEWFNLFESIHDLLGNGRHVANFIEHF